MTAEQVDTQERASFLAWRRDLAAVEEEEVLVLTPFEKNIEMWRQLWRVVERSHVVVQVVDARDPVLYRSTDLEAYAREINPAKSSIVLLNKADLLTVDQRHAWAEYFEGQGVRYAFWSAKAATAAQQEGGGVGGVGNGVGGGGAGLHEGNALPAGDEGNAGDWGARLMGVEELLDWLECEAKGAAIAAGEEVCVCVCWWREVVCVGFSFCVCVLVGGGCVCVCRGVCMGETCVAGTFVHVYHVCTYSHAMCLYEQCV